MHPVALSLLVRRVLPRAYYIDDLGKNLLSLGVQVHKHVARALKVPIRSYLEQLFKQHGSVCFPHTQRLPQYK